MKNQNIHCVLQFIADVHSYRLLHIQDHPGDVDVDDGDVELGDVDDGDDDVHRGVVRANRLLHNLVQPSLTINSLWLFMGSTLKGGRGACMGNSKLAPHCRKNSTQCFPQLSMVKYLFYTYTYAICISNIYKSAKVILSNIDKSVIKLQSEKQRNRIFSAIWGSLAKGACQTLSAAT